MTHFKEYYIENKFIGNLVCAPDRNTIGYNGIATEVLLNQIVLDNNKKIKAGTKVRTMLYPLDLKNNGIRQK